MFDGNFDIHIHFHLLYSSFEILETIDLLCLTGISYPFSERSQKKKFFLKKERKGKKMFVPHLVDEIFGGSKES